MLRLNVLFIFFITSCGSLTTPPQVPVEKTYSEETNRAFSMIENNGSYRSKKTHPPVTKENAIPQVSHSAKKSTPSSLVEVNQYLAFYCMQHRKSKRFNGNEKKCLAHVHSTLKKCQTAHFESQNKLLRCVKSKIKT